MTEEKQLTPLEALDMAAYKIREMLNHGVFEEIERKNFEEALGRIDMVLAQLGRINMVLAHSRADDKKRRTSNPMSGDVQTTEDKTAPLNSDMLQQELRLHMESLIARGAILWATTRMRKLPIAELRLISAEMASAGALELALRLYNIIIELEG